MRRDPRGGDGIDIRLEGDGAWPDLNPRRVTHAKTIAVAALARATHEGLASVLWRLGLPDGRTVLAEMTLRELHSVWQAIVTRYGEDFMKQGLGAKSDMEERLGLVVAELARQLTEAQIALGQEPVLDFTRADREYDALVKRRQAGTP